MSLRTRVALLLAAIVLPAMVIAGFGAAFGASSSVENTIDISLARQIDSIRNSPDSLIRLAKGERDAAPRRGGPGDLGRNDQRVQLLDMAGAAYVLDDNDELPVIDADRMIARDGGADRYRTVRIGNRSLRMVTARLDDVMFDNGRGPVTVQLARTFEDLASVRAAILRQVAMFSVIGALLAGAAGWMISRRIMAPVEALTAATERVAATQDLSQHIEVTQSDEVGRLARSFNTMLDALSTSRQQQRQLVQDANHELRTPLTSIRTNVDLLRRNTEVPAEMRSEILRDVSAELDELTLLVTEVVSSATDVTGTNEPATDFDLVELTEAVAERTRRRSDRVIGVVDNPQLDTMVHASEPMIERAISNLLNNAVKFSPEGSPIQVRVDGTRVRVDDHGPGIPVADRARVFDRFYRADDARTQPGSGLGLAIVKQVAETHGGSVFAESSPSGGASVGFEIATSSELAAAPQRTD